MKVDYNAAAELYIPTARPGRRGRPVYRRFSTAVEAIRFAMEDLPTMRSFGPWMQVGDERFLPPGFLADRAYNAVTVAWS